MEVDNIVRIVLEGIGWDVYSKIVMLIMGLNIHYLPFVVTMLINWWDTRRSQEAGMATLVEWRRNYTDIYSMMIVVVLFFVPNSNTQMGSHEIAGVSMATALDSNFEFSTQPYSVPPGWWAVFKLSNAVIAQMKDWIGAGENYRHIMETFTTSKIENDPLKVEVSNFYNSCYVPVFSRWRHERQQPYPTPQVGDDLTYIGNQLFQDAPGYYQSCKASDRSAGGVCYGSNEKMPIEVAERLGVQTNFQTDPNPEKRIPAISFTDTPSCYTWWTGNSDRSYSGDLGNNFTPLKERLITYAKELLESGNADQYGVESSTVSDENAELLVKRMLKNDPPTTQVTIDSSPSSQGEESLWSIAKGGIVDFIGSIGAIILALIFEVTISILVPLIYMVHALAIFAFITVTPLILLFTRFSIGVVANLIVLLFGILFLSFIWHLADILYNHLLAILYGGEDSTFSDLSLKETKMQLIFFIFTFFVYLYLPAYVVRFASSAGMKWEDVTNDAMSMGDKTQGASKVPVNAGLNKLQDKDSK